MKKIKRELTITDTLRGLSLGEAIQFDMIDYPIDGLRSAARTVRKELGYDFTISRKRGESFTTIMRTL